MLLVSTSHSQISSFLRNKSTVEMAHSKALCFLAVAVAVLAATEAFPRPGPQSAVAGSGPAPLEAPKGEKTDLKAENSYGIGYAYGGVGPWGYGGYPYSYGYGYPYSYAYGYPYGYGYGGYGGYGYPFYG